jgi:magnesium-transporting ATPase (P-type)
MPLDVLVEKAGMLVPISAVQSTLYSLGVHVCDTDVRPSTVDMSMFWFLIYNSFDATYLFEYTFILLYNLIFTSLPVGILGAFDQDTNAAASMAFPALYKRGIQGLEYTRRRFWFYMTDGLYQSVIIFFIPYLAYATRTIQVMNVQ